MTIRRVLRAFVVLAVLLAAAAPSDADDLSHWVGRYPTDRQIHPPARLFNTQVVRAGLQRLLTQADRSHLRALSVETPIEQSGPFLVVRKCMPHDCGNQNAMVVLDGDARRMWVGLFARTPAVTSTRWFGTSDFHDLPAEVLKSFDDQHQPR